MIYYLIGEKNVGEKWREKWSWKRLAFSEEKWRIWNFGRGKMTKMFLGVIKSPTLFSPIRYITNVLDRWKILSKGWPPIITWLYDYSDMMYCFWLYPTNYYNGKSSPTKKIVWSKNCKTALYTNPGFRLSRKKHLSSSLSWTKSWLQRSFKKWNCLVRR